MMSITTILPFIFFATVILGACSGGLNDSGNDGATVVPLENISADTTAAVQVLGQRELDILNLVKQRSNYDGARYQFDQLIPVFEQNGDTVNVRFNYVSPDTVGGSPIVEYSLSRRAITSIVYTQ